MIFLFWVFRLRTKLRKLLQNVSAFVLNLSRSERIASRLQLLLSRVWRVTRFIYYFIFSSPSRCGHERSSTKSRIASNVYSRRLFVVVFHFFFFRSERSRPNALARKHKILHPVLHDDLHVKHRSRRRRAVGVFAVETNCFHSECIRFTYSGNVFPRRLYPRIINFAELKQN